MIYKKDYFSSPCIKHECLYRIIKRLFLKNAILNKIAYKYINHFEGGQYYSQTLRRIFRETYDIDVGLGSYGGIFQGGVRPHVKVGRYCSFGTGIQRLYANHPMTDVSTHPLFHLKEFGCVSENNNPVYSLEIGNDVWIGVNSIITSKCRKIGDGAVIGAGSIVTHDIEPYAIYAGNPARLIRFRFNTEIRSILQHSKWYELDPDQLEPLIKDFISIEDFCHKVLSIRQIHD